MHWDSGAKPPPWGHHRPDVESHRSTPPLHGLRAISCPPSHLHPEDGRALSPTGAWGLAGQLPQRSSLEPGCSLALPPSVETPPSPPSLIHHRPSTRLRVTQRPLSRIPGRLEPLHSSGKNLKRFGGWWAGAKPCLSPVGRGAQGAARSQASELSSSREPSPVLCGGGQGRGEPVRHARPAGSKGPSLRAMVLQGEGRVPNSPATGRHSVLQTPRGAADMAWARLDGCLEAAGGLGQLGRRRWVTGHGRGHGQQVSGA